LAPSCWALGLALLFLAPHVHAATVANGPMIGMLTPSEATVWLRLDAEARVRLRYQEQGNENDFFVDVGEALELQDFTLKVTLKGLAHSHVYHYAIGVTQPDGTETWTPRSYFRTLARRPAGIDFVVLTDFANDLEPSQALATAAATRPGFLAVIGDMDHRGLGINHGSASTVLENMRAMHRQMRDPQTPIGAQMVAGLMASTPSAPQIPFYEVWDDHDYCGNNSGASCPVRALAFQAWREYFAWPHDSGLAGAGCGGEGVWQRFALGTVATVFMLDARSNRTPSTMLGACQLAWLIAGLREASTTWKFILSPVPFNPDTKTWDAWSRFNNTPSSDRQQLLQAIAVYDIRNVVVLSGDIHTGGAVDDGSHSGLPEVSVPHANLPSDFVNTYCSFKASDQTLISQPGTWTIGGLVDPNIGVVPPRCLGRFYPDANLGPLATQPYPLDGADSPGYVQVRATLQSAAVQVFGADGTARLGVRADGSSELLGLDLIAR
jgi:alkaline phosphatase D